MFNISEEIEKYLKKKQQEKAETTAKLTSNNDGDYKISDTEERKKYLSTVSALKNAQNGVESSGGKESVVKLDKIEYVPLDSEEIEKKAKDSVESEYQLKLNALNKQLNDKKETAIKNSEEVVLEGAEKKKVIDEMYKSLEKDTEENAIKRGIARSSIVAEQLKGLGVEKIKDVLSVDNQVAEKIKGYNDEIAKLESDYTSAVETLDIEKAIDVKEKIEKLTKEQADKLEEVLKYNNTVTKNQAYLDDKFGTTFTSNEDLTNAEYNEKIILASLDYYKTLPKEERLNAFKNDKDVQAVLGPLADTIERYIRDLI